MVNRLKVLRGFVALTRPIASIGGGANYLLGAYFAGVASSTPSTLAASSVAVALSFASFMVFNDVVDLASDRINGNKHRPLVESTVSAASAQILCFSLVTCSLVAAALVGPVAAVWCAALTVLGFGYSLVGRRAFWVGPIYVAFVSSLPVFYGAEGNHTLHSVVAHALLFHFVVISEILKCMRDIAGDKAVGYMTAGVVLGPIRTVRLWRVLGCSFVVTVFLGGRLVDAGPVFYFLMVGAVLLPLIVMMFSSWVISRSHDLIRILTLTWVPGYLALGALK